MALTTTTFSPPGVQFPYIGIGVAAAQYITAIPSAEIVHTVRDEAITVAGSGNEQVVIITCDLPASFCYVLVESWFRITSDNADDWDQQAVANFTDSLTASVVTMPLIYDNDQLGRNSVAELSRTYGLKTVPSKLIVPTSNDDARVTVKIFNVVQNGGVGVMKFYARFLRFDRNQAQYWQVNTPVLTR